MLLFSPSPSPVLWRTGRVLEEHEDLGFARYILQKWGGMPVMEDLLNKSEVPDCQCR